MSEIEPHPEDLVASLRRSEAFTDDATAAEGVEWIQTHISHLFLTRTRVYKLRKAVELSFLSFATRAARNADCLREVELNRRLASDVYLGVAPILPRGERQWELGAVGEDLCDTEGRARADPEQAAEHCVVMRRLPDGRDALAMLEAGTLTSRHVEALADRLVTFHRDVGLGTPAPWSPQEWLDRIDRPVESSFELAREAGRDLLDAAQLDRAQQAMQRWREDHRERLLERRAEGRAVDGHGDLHLDHVWYPDDDEPPVVIDCVEFDAELRRIDVAAELAFFVMDAAYRGREDLGERLLDRYATISDDYGLYDVVEHSVLHRALVRASVAAVAHGESEIDREQRERAASSARGHLGLIVERLDRPSRAAIVITTGLPGTGKSTAAATAARALGAVTIASDRVRKQLAGLPATARGEASPGAGIYTAERSRAVYAGLRTRAEPVLRSGRPVVLDATFSRSGEREAVRLWAKDLGLPVVLIDVQCPESVALARIEARLADPDRISDAGPEVYRTKKASYEPPREWPEADRLRVDTSAPDWREALAIGLDEIIGAARSRG